VASGRRSPWRGRWPQPRALLLDEPLAALDATTRDTTRKFLGDALRRLDIPSLVVTHAMADVVALDGPVVLLEGGRVRSVGALPRCVRPAERVRAGSAAGHVKFS
jgi:molybdate transport system ATP-binding protein